MPYFCLPTVERTTVVFDAVYAWLFFSLPILGYRESKLWSCCLSAPLYCSICRPCGTGGVTPTEDTITWIYIPVSLLSTGKGIIYFMGGIDFCSLVPNLTLTLTLTLCGLGTRLRLLLHCFYIECTPIYQVLPYITAFFPVTFEKVHPYVSCKVCQSLYTCWSVLIIFIHSTQLSHLYVLCTHEHTQTLALLYQQCPQLLFCVRLLPLR